MSVAKLSWSLTVAPSVEHGLELIQTGAVLPALVLFCYRLADPGTFALLKKLRQELPRSVPIIVLDGLASVEDVKSAYVNGADSFQPKPKGRTAIRECIQATAEFWRLAQPGSDRRG